MDLQNSVVAVIDGNRKVIGTGFVAGENLILTCAHVVETASAGLNEQVTVRFASGGSEAVAHVEPGSFSPSYEQDVVLLRVETLPPGVRPLPLAPAAGSTGHDFHAYGYATVIQVQGLGARGRIVELVEHGRLVQLNSQEPDHGMSGGPVLDEQRRVVIGMITKGKKSLEKDQNLRNTQTTFATSAEVIFEVCRELKPAEICPYRSLEAFTEEDASFFFGRERVINKLLESLKREPRFLAVLGPSGSGKSSVVRAGLIPALRQGKLPGSQQWDILIIRPADNPFEQLAGAGFLNPQSGLESSIQSWLADRPEKTRLVLVIDQFEEVLVSTPVDVRQAFVTELAQLLDAPLAVTVILTLRDDFYSLFLQDATELANSLEHGLVNIPPTLEPDELRSIVIEPAQKAGLIFEEGLVSAIINDAAEIENAKHIVRNTILPLVEFTLTQLWKTRQDGQVTTHSYHEIGKVTGGVSQWANEIYDELDKEQRKVAKQIVCELVNLGDKSIGVKDTRRVKTVQSLLGKDAVRQEVFDRLVTARILVTKFFEETGKEEIVEIIHEVLIYQWGELRKWLDENRILLTWGQEMEKRNLSKGALSWGEIIQAWKFQANPENYFQLTSETARHFVSNSIKQSIWLSLGVVGLITFAITVGFLVSNTSRSVVRARSIMDNAQLIYENDPWLGQRLGLEALAIAPQLDSGSYATIADAAKALLKWLPLGNAVEKVIPISEQVFILDHSAVSGELRRTTDGSLIVALAGQVNTAFASSSGEYFVVTYSGGLPAELRQAPEGRLIARLGKDILRVTFSNDSKTGYFVTDALDASLPGELYRTADGTLVTKLTASIPYDGVSFNPDPYTRYVKINYEGDVPAELRRTADGAVIPLSGTIGSLYFSPDPDLPYFVIDYKDSSLIEKRQITDGKIIGTLEDFNGFNLAYSPDAKKTYFVTINEDGSPSQLRRTAEGALIAVLPGQVRSAKFSQDPEAAYVALSYADDLPGELRWTSDGRVVDTFPLQPQSSVTIDQDPGLTYLAANYTENIPSELRQMLDGAPAKFDGTVKKITFDAKDAPQYAVVYFASETSAKLLHLADGETISLTGPVKEALFSSFLPDRFVVNYQDGSPGQLLNLNDASLVTPFWGPVKSIAGSLNSKSDYFVVNYAGLPGELRRKSDGQPVTQLTAEVEKLTFSPDSNETYFIAGYVGKTPDELRRTADGQLLAKLGEDIYQAAFSGDAQASYFITYTLGGGGKLYHTQNGTLIAQLGMGGYNIKFSEDARASYVVTDALDSKMPGELRRTSDGALLATLTASPTYDGVTFSSDSEARYLLLEYDGSFAPELRRTSDGALLATLPASPTYDGVTFSSDSEARYLLLKYDGNLAPELRRTADGSAIPLSGLVDKAYFSPDPETPYFVVNYKDSKLIEKRQITDGKVIGTLERFSGFNITYSPDANKTYYVTNPDEEAPGKLYRAADSTLIAVLSGKPRSVTFSRDPEITYVAIGYTDGLPGELRRTVDGSIVTLPHLFNQINFNSNPAAPYFIVQYQDQVPPELRKIKDGAAAPFALRSLTLDRAYDPQYAVLYPADETPTQLLHLEDGKIIALNGSVEKALFSASLPGLVILNYRDGSPGLLFDLKDGSVVTPFSGPVKSIIGSSNAKLDYFVVNYENLPGELRRKSNGGRVVVRLPELAKSITGSSDSTWDYFAINYESLPGELRRTSDGLPVTQLTAEVEKLTFSPDSQKSYFVAVYAGKIPGELRRTADGQLLAELSEDIYQVIFSPDGSASYFVVDTSGSATPGKLYRSFDGALIAQLGLDASSLTFSKDAGASYFVVGSPNSSAPGELYRTADGAFLAKLPASPAYSGVSFSSDPETSYVLVKYAGSAAPELRRTADGSVVSVSGLIDSVYFGPNPDLPYFVVSYKDSKRIEKRQITDGQVIGTLESFSGFSFTCSSDANPTYCVSYGGVTSELRRLGDNTLIARLPGETSSVKFSQDPDVTYVALSYADGLPGELRRTADGSIVTLPHRIAQVNFNSNPASPYFEIQYKEEERSSLYEGPNGSPVAFDNSLSRVTFCPDQKETCFLAAFQADQPTELRRNRDNAIIARFTDDLTYVAFSPDPGASYFVAGYPGNIPGELRRTTNGGLVTLLTGPVKSVVFSEDAKYFVATYLGDLSPELRRTADGKNLFKPAHPVETILLSPKSERAFFVVNYKDKNPSELFSDLQPNRIAELSAVAGTVLFSSDRQTNFLLITYPNAPAELRRTTDGNLVNLSGLIEKVYFSPDPEASYFVITYKDKVPPEQRRLSDGSVIAVLTEFSGFNIKYSPDTAQSFFVFTPEADAPSKLFLTKGNLPLATLTGKAISSTLLFAPSQKPAYLLINYQAAQSELWFLQDKPYRSIQLGSAFENAYFEDNRLILKYKDGRAYLVFLDFLSTLGKRLEEVPTDLLMKTVCQQPLFANQDEQALEKILGSKPTTCK